MKKIAYLVIAHGSREKEANEAFFRFLEKLREIIADRRVEGAFLELAQPGILEAIEECFRGGSREIVVIPLMFFPGRHVKNDIPRFIEEAKIKHPEIDFHYCGPLSDHPLMLGLIEQQAKLLLRQGNVPCP